MAKRDRAEYMRGYRAAQKIAEPWTAQTVLSLSASIQAMSQAERDRILRKLTK